MGSQGVGDIPTIFHPQQIHAPSIILGDGQQNHGPQSTSGQLTRDNSGKCKFNIHYGSSKIGYQLHT